MKEEITTVFCISDELHKAMGIHEDPQVKMNNAEVMTTALTASLFFSGNYEKSRIFLSEHGYIAWLNYTNGQTQIMNTPWTAFLFLCVTTFASVEAVSTRVKNTGVTFPAKDVISMVSGSILW
jgi:hypothetical protein